MRPANKGDIEKFSPDSIVKVVVEFGQAALTIDGKQVLDQGVEMKLGQFIEVLTKWSKKEDK